MSAPSQALAGVRVIEISNERIAFAGKLLANMGADVILVEPPGGDPARGYPPFVDDQPGPERSLWWWHYHTSKKGVVLDLETPEGRAGFEQLAVGADILLESSPSAASAMTLRSIFGLNLSFRGPRPRRPARGPGATAPVR